MSNGWKHYLRLAAILIGLPTLIAWAAEEQALSFDERMSPGLLTGAVLSQVSMVLYAMRFRQVLTSVGIHLPALVALRITALSLFYYFFVPLSVGSDITKFLKLKAANYDAFDSASAIVLDHMIGLASLMILSIGVFACFRPLEIDLSSAAIGALILIVVLAAAVGALHYHRTSATSLRTLVQSIWRHRVTLLVALVYALCMHLCLITAVYIGSSSWGFDISFTDMVFAMATAMMFQAIPFTLAGAGVAEAAGAGLYVALGLTLPAAVLLVSLVYSYRLLMAIVGGVWDLLPHQAQAE